VDPNDQSTAVADTLGEEAKTDVTMPSAFRVVGIGASAGGLESLERFFGAMPVDSGMAFVVVQHLSPDFKTLMAELLARYSDMKITLAVDGELVEPNHVYLLPPGKELEIHGARLRLTRKESRALAQPIDVFFRSLAADMGPRAVAIVLSGSGSDGSHGIRAVKSAGGTVLAESVNTAGFDGMPSSAAATGVVDFVGAPDELAGFLSGADASEHVLGADGAEPPAPEPTEPLAMVLALLDQQFGIDFSRYKLTTVTRRLERRVSLKGLPDMAAYLEELRSDPAEQSSLYQDLLIGVTSFFRDPDAFEFIEHRVIPEVLAQVPAGEQIRVWVAGCATGEEAYSLAILFHEALLRTGRPVNLKVLATDMHRASLDTAVTGIYPREFLAHVDPARRARYFVETRAAYQVSPELRQLVVFAPHNVMKDAPFTRMHLISCRNLLIYLRPEVQRSVLSLFHFGLASSGVLFLGASETMGTLAQEFTTLNERWKVFRKRRDIRLIEPLQLTASHAAAAPRPTILDAGRSRRVDPQLLASYDRLLDRFMPPSFLVDKDAALLDSFSGAERLLRPKSRRPTGNLLDMLDGDLRTVIAGALGRVARERAPIVCRNVSVEENGGLSDYTVRLELVQQPRADQCHVLVTLEKSADTEAPALSRANDGEVSVAQASRERMQSLEGELSYAREVLQSTIEELETSNEELQATNEELVASNEELQSTNEELHSVNEELYTVNAEYQSKIEELQQLNADIRHLLEGTEVGTVFLDGDLRIRRYTERIGRVFRIQDRDLGREIRDFSYTLQRPTLIEEIERALNYGEVTEDEVRDEQGRPHFLRILPYRTGARDQMADGTQTAARPPSGVVLTITDISALDRARERLAQLSAIVESSEDAILRKDLNGRIETWNHGAERLYGYTAEEAIGKDVRFLCTEEGARDVDRLLSAIRRGERIDHVETMRIRKDGKIIDVSVSISPVLDDEGNVVAASAIARDITALRNAQREAEQRQQRIQQLLDSTAEAIYGLDVQGICTFCNPACARLLGYADPSELIGRDMHELVHRGRLATAPHECGLTTALRGGGPAHSSDEVFWRSDGTCFAAEYWCHPVERDNKVVGAVVTFLDITERRQAEEEVRAAARRRERFLALLSHELRNPLSAILNAIRVVSSGAVATEIQERARHVAERQGRHMARLLDDLLDVSRITSGKFELRKERVRIDDSVNAAIEALEPLLRDHGLTLSATLPSTPLFVDGDGARLQQVVANLLSNAARYSEGGSNVELSLRAEGRSVVLSVRDWGVGIEPAFLPHVFDLFAQSDRAARLARGGLGIGLTLVRRIVELHDGTVEAKSAGPGLGSEFVVRIPMSTGAAARASQPAVGGAEQCRIVLVEDQPDAREMMRALLELRGHTVVDVGDAREAIETIGREQPDVAVVDIGLPELSGYDVARAVRSGPGGDQVFMVALTGYGSQADVRAAEEAGFDAHLTKPAEPERLFQLLARRAPSESRRRSGAWSEVDGVDRADVPPSPSNLSN
jgi:two-component system, chemotaxis family, CheB/CheR fusion protein